MRIAGVRLEDGRVVWVEAGDGEVQPLDAVVVAFDGTESRGVVIVAPDALLRPVEPSGRISRHEPRIVEEDECAILPGADMPPLGSSWGGDVVVSIDAVNRRVTVEAMDGTRKVASLDAS